MMPSLIDLLEIFIFAFLSRMVTYFLEIQKDGPLKLYWGSLYFVEYRLQKKNLFCIAKITKPLGTCMMCFNNTVAVVNFSLIYGWENPLWAVVFCLFALFWWEILSRNKPQDDYG